MRRGVVMIWLALCCWVQVVPADARVGMYFVDGMEQFPVEKKSMSCLLYTSDAADEL